MASQTIKLKRPFQIMEHTVTELKIKEPTGQNYADFGEPFLYVRNLDGAIYTIEQNDVLKRYFVACIDHELGGSTCLALMCLSDVKKVKQVILGFFTDADEGIYSQNATDSSSAAA